MAQASSLPFTVRIKTSGTGPLPAWVPPEGHFSNISLNTMYSARPSGWPNSDVAGPFANWSGGVYASDFSSLGAYVVHGSGHLTPGSPLWAGVWCFDLDTLRWEGRNVPGAPLIDPAPAEWGQYYNEYGESKRPESLGFPSVPHTYDGLMYVPSAMGGGPQGSLLQCFSAGHGITFNSVRKYDLSLRTSPPTRVVDAIAWGTQNKGSYPAAAVDTARKGFWINRANGQGPVKFVKFADWSVTDVQIGYNDYGDHSLVYIPAPYDCIVGMGRANMDNTLVNVWVCPIVSGNPQGFTKVAVTGTPPNDGRCGGAWSTILNCIVSYQARGSNVVHKLTPPVPGNLTGGTWTWTSETLAGMNGATPSHAINPNNGSGFDNGAWGRFVEVPAARCFIWCDGVQQPVQAWRLTGM